MKFWLAIAVAFFSWGSLAQARPSTYKMTCRQAQNLVRSRGAVTMNYGRGPGGDLYERFVVSVGYCTMGEGAYAAWVPTRDNPQCFVGYVCQDRGDAP
jgi:hypothetical protein